MSVIFIRHCKSCENPIATVELDYYTESRSSVNREEEYGEQFFHFGLIGLMI